MKQIALFFKMVGIQLYYVGGCVRDKLMNIPYNDMDICIVGGTSLESIHSLLETLKEVGQIQELTTVFGNFPVWIVKVGEVKYEFAMARTEKKSGQAHQDFLCEVNTVSLEEDLSRRDLTINAIAKNILTGEIVDPFNGKFDIENKIARPVSDAFKEDPLRVLRAARFIARFDLVPSFKLIEVCKELTPEGISYERVGKELMKLFQSPKDTKVSKFFYFLKNCNWLKYHFEEVYNLIGVPQNTVTHPEGDAFVHTMHCIDAADNWFIRAVMLCHDLGKATHTTINGIEWKKSDFWLPESSLLKINTEYKIKSIGHEDAGIELTLALLKRIHFTSHNIIKQIACLVSLHMIRIQVASSKVKIVRRTLRKLMSYNLDYSLLVEVVKCDLAGRPSLIFPHPEIGQDYAFKLIESGAMDPIVTGEFLIQNGIQPGPEMGKIIKKALELQDRGTLNKDNWKIMLYNYGFKLLNYEKRTIQVKRNNE